MQFAVWCNYINVYLFFIRPSDFATYLWSRMSIGALIMSQASYEVILLHSSIIIWLQQNLIILGIWTHDRKSSALTARPKRHYLTYKNARVKFAAALTAVVMIIVRFFLWVTAITKVYSLDTCWSTPGSLSDPPSSSSWCWWWCCDVILRHFGALGWSWCDDGDALWWW